MTIKKVLFISGGVLLTLSITTIGILILVFTFGSESLSRSDTPLSREDAIKQHFGIPLPLSAHNIYYLEYAGGLQRLESYFRFDVDPAERESCIEAMIQENNTTMNRQLSYKPITVAAASNIIPSKDFLPMQWWELQSIQKGYYRGEEVSYALNIWVDTEKNRIFVHTSD